MKKVLKYEIGNRIAELRRAMHLTQDQLSEMIEVSVKHISAVERGKSSLSLEKLIKACEALDVSLDYLVIGTNYNDTDTPIPKYALEVFQSSDPAEIELLMEYLRLYKKLREK